jgi:cytochrome c peroxidase
MTAQARRGFEVFRERGCIRCHPVDARGTIFSDQGFHNVGTAWRSAQRRSQDVTVQLVPGLSARLEPQALARIGVIDEPDQGRFEVTGRRKDLRAFRTPTLRNVSLTAPYMHDGSFDTLEQVIDHYAAGGSLGDPAQDPFIQAFTISDDDRQSLVSFLQALTSRTAPERRYGYR